MESVHGGSASAMASMEGDHSVASTNLRGDDFVQTALGGTGGSTTAEASAVAPMPGVLGDELSSSKGEDGGGDNASIPNDVEVRSVGRRPSMAPMVEESKD